MRRNCISQTTGNPISFENVIKTDSIISKSALYQSALQWFAETYKSSNEVIQLKDTSGIIVGKASFNAFLKGFGLAPSTSRYIDYVIRLNFKDSKVKVTIEKFNDGGYIVTDGEPEYKGMGSKTAKKYYEQLKESISTFSNGIQLSLQSWFAKIEFGKNDW